MAVKYKFRDGRLTPYALGCGYIEQKSTNPTMLRENDIYVSFYYRHGHYHVRKIDYRDGVLRLIYDLAYHQDFHGARAKFDSEPGEIVDVD